MPQERLKSDNYENFGGVNTKASRYLTGPREVLDAFNVDGSTTGDMTGRPGSTQYFSATFSGSLITGLYEYSKLSGYSKIIVGHPGGMWLGQDNSVTGISLGNMLTGQTHATVLGVTTLQTIPSATFTSNRWDFATSNDNLFFGDGRSFLKFNGTTQQYWGLPDVVFNGLNDIGFTTAAGNGSSQGKWYFAFAYINDRGFVGPARIRTGNVDPGAGASKSLYLNITFPITGYGITAMAIYTYFAGATSVPAWETSATLEALRAGTPTGAPFAITPNRPDEDFRLLAVVPTGTTLYGPVDAPFNQLGAIPKPYVPFGQTNFLQAYGVTDILLVKEQTVAPEIVETYKNHLFWVPPDSSSAYFSDLGEPEGWESENEFEFRTGDGDKIRAAKNFGNRLIFAKEMSFHELTGDDAENFQTRQVSDEYGVLNNRACCVWEGVFWGLDRKGIIQYTGGLPKIISEKVEDKFKRMNLAVARNTAQMIYMKNRNEVWTMIPLDNSTVNNLLIIFDTVAQQWYFWDGPNISILAKLIGRMGQETSFYGDHVGRINTFGASFFGDNGAGFTSLVKFRYETPRGRSVENVFRRCFVDAESMAGNVTLPIEMKFRADYGSSYQVAASLVLTDMQNVVDFGIPAKSLSVEISHFSAVDSMRLHGYVLESRWQRNT